MGSRTSEVADSTGWYPSDPKYRDWFNHALANAVQKAGQHGDTRRITALVNRIENDEIRKAVLRKLLQLVPLDFNRSTGGLKLRKVGAAFDWSNIPRINVFGTRIQIHNDTIKLGNAEFSVSEFIDEIIDALILARNSIPSDSLMRLSETVSAIATHSQKRTQR
jgi:hypothetical protein